MLSKWGLSPLNRALLYPQKRKKLLDTFSVLRHLSLRNGCSLAAICTWQCIVAPALCVAAPQQTNPIEPVRSAVVTAVTSEIVIDGSLDEAPWHQAPKIGDLVQRIPEAGAEPTEKTQVTLLYDEENLYIGVMCHDSEPRRVLASQMARDARLNADDRLAALVGTFLGILLSYGFAQPLATALEHRTVHDGHYIRCIRAGVLALHKGLAPQIAIEFAQRVIPGEVRPTFEEAEEFCRGEKTDIKEAA